MKTLNLGEVSTTHSVIVVTDGARTGGGKHGRSLECLHLS